MKEIRLKKGKESSLERFHPWIFSGALESTSPALSEGDIVKVLAHDGKVLGYGDWQIGSIAVRMLAFGECYPDFQHFMNLINDAWMMRRALKLKNHLNDTFRLIHGEGDFLPGLIVDIYGPTAVVQAHSAGMHLRRMDIARALVAVQGLGVENVFYKSETTLPFKANLNPRDGYIIGEYSGSVAIENGLKFNIDWLKGQKTGFFIDQRDNRLRLSNYSSGRTVLNMFCYTGGFSVYALKGGAKEVVSVDSSAKAISLTEENVRLNFDETIATRHQSVTEDAFKYLEALPQGKFDCIVLDPPAFAKHRDAVPNALRGYQKLNAAAMRKIAPRSFLFTFSCSQAVSKEQFRLAVFSAAASVGRRVRILHQLTQPADHPVNIYHPEGEYLKGLVLYIE